MKRQFRYTLIAGLAAVGLALAGCGGGGGGNLSNEVRDLKSQLADAQAARTAAEARATAAEAAKAAADAAQAAAEAAQAAAEQAQADAEAAQAAAETERDAAVAARMQAEADKMAAEAAQMQAEAAQAAAEAAQMQAEAAQMAAEAAQATAEAERDTANAAAAVSEQARMDAEAARAAAEAARVAAVEARATAEAERDGANAAKTAAEAAQAEAEAAQAEAEAAQATAEAAQAAAEAEAAAAKSAQADAEAAQATAEAAQADAEAAQATAEAAQAAAEAERDTATAARDDLQTQLTAAQADVTRLTGELETARSTGSASADEVTRLTGELAAANAEVTRLTGELATANAEVTRLTGEVNSLTAERDRYKKMVDDAAAAADRARQAAATAAKLFAGIYAPAADATGTEVGDVHAAYNTDATMIVVTMGDGTTANATNLSEDKKTTVADNHGWEGKRYADPAGGDSVEAVVYSNVGEPEQGNKFGQIGVTPANTGAGYQYGLDAQGRLVVDTTTEAVQMRVASSSFDQGAGVKTFKKATNTVAVQISGMYHGVSGTYSCTPSGDTICASRVAADGFELGTVASATDSTFTVGTTGWTFKPSNPEARVESAPDNMYVSYGWWLHKTENGKTYTASAFVSVKGTVDAAAGLDALNGTATYMGGAAGKYALSSSTGGANEAGHFTARATLEADFSDDSITGTIDQFRVGDDGEARDGWSVELKEAAIADTGGITRAADNDTVWTIDGDAASASGEWSGTLYDNGADNVPKVGTGTFYTEYGQDGKMVGAFGVNKQ